MAGISATWLGVGEVLAALEKVSKQADLASRTMVSRMAAEVEKAAKANFEGSHARGEAHVGGDKPNVVSGDLRRSITHDPIRKDGLMSWSTRVGPTMIYSRRVELGGTGPAWGRGTATTRPFPYFEPAVRSIRPRLEVIAAEEWATFMRL